MFVPFAPLRSRNSALKREELPRRIDNRKSVGCGGFVVHARTLPRARHEAGRAVRAAARRNNMKGKKAACGILALFAAFMFGGCLFPPPSSDGDGDGGTGNGGTDLPAIERVRDTRDLNDFEYSVNSLSATDALGRSFASADREIKESYVGMFYFLWLGEHPSEMTGVYDITKLLAENRAYIFDAAGKYEEKSKTGQYHFWGEPLYGYYRSSDEWVIRKHIEAFVMAGIDFLCFDTTNGFAYEQNALTVMRVLEEYRAAGWNAPQVMFYTHTHSFATANTIYRNIYAAHPEYAALWFAPHGKPLIVASENEFTGADGKTLSSFFEVRPPQWPNGNYDKNGFPWMSFTYPQSNHNGVMSVSVAQHNTVRMSNESRGNSGRGYNVATFENEEDKGDAGLNYQSQWDTVLRDPAKVETAFVTGWNEWVALKLRGDGTPGSTGMPFFVDTFSQNYSRDVEFMKGGYGDNFYLQTADNIRRYKYTKAKHYEYHCVSPASPDDRLWEGVRAYRDPAGDCADRNSAGFCSSVRYADNSGRNDIVSVQATHDGENLYLKIVCAAPIAPREQGDETFLNVLLGTEAEGYRYGGFQFLVNRLQEGSRSLVERITAYGRYERVGTAECTLSGNAVMLSLPLACLGVTKDACHLKIKAFDHIALDENNADFSQFYCKGDSAPFGRLAYTYGY